MQEPAQDPKPSGCLAVFARWRDLSLWVINGILQQVLQILTTLFGSGPLNSEEHRPDYPQQDEDK